MDIFDRVIFGDRVTFEYEEEEEEYFAEEIYVDHGNGWITEGDTYNGVLTFYECDGCGAPVNGPSSYCHSCGHNAIH